MPRTEAELQQMVKHVQYEIDEFRLSFDALVKMGRERPPEWNRTVESVLIHFRVLRGFFFREERGNSDVFAHDYVNNWVYKNAQVKDASNVFGRTKDPIDRRVAHLTLDRTTDFVWTELNEMRKEIDRLAEEFAIALPAQYAPWFPRLRRAEVGSVLTVADCSTVTKSSLVVLWDEFSQKNS